MNKERIEIEKANKKIDSLKEKPIRTYLSIEDLWKSWNEYQEWTDALEVFIKAYEKEEDPNYEFYWKIRIEIAYQALNRWRQRVNYYVRWIEWTEKGWSIIKRNIKDKPSIAADLWEHTNQQYITETKWDEWRKIKSRLYAEIYSSKILSSEIKIKEMKKSKAPKIATFFSKRLKENNRYIDQNIKIAEGELAKELADTPGGESLSKASRREKRKAKRRALKLA